MVNGNDILEFEEAHPELQDEYLAEYLVTEETPKIIIEQLLQTQAYQDFVLSEMN